MTFLYYDLLTTCFNQFFSPIFFFYKNYIILFFPFSRAQNCTDCTCRCKFLTHALTPIDNSSDWWFGQMVILIVIVLYFSGSHSKATARCILGGWKVTCPKRMWKSGQNSIIQSQSKFFGTFDRFIWFFFRYELAGHNDRYNKTI